MSYSRFGSVLVALFLVVSSIGGFVGLVGAQETNSGELVCETDADRERLLAEQAALQQRDGELYRAQDAMRLRHGAEREALLAEQQAEIDSMYPIETVDQAAALARLQRAHRDRILALSEQHKQESNRLYVERTANMEQIWAIDRALQECGATVGGERPEQPGTPGEISNQPASSSEAATDESTQDTTTNETPIGTEEAIVGTVAVGTAVTAGSVVKRRLRARAVKVGTPATGPVDSKASVADYVSATPVSDSLGTAKQSVTTAGDLTDRAETVTRYSNNKALKTAGKLGKVAKPVGYALDVFQIAEAYQSEGKVGRETKKTVARVGGGFIGGSVGAYYGAIGGAEVGGAIGAAVGFSLLPPVAIPVTVGGAVIGGAVGLGGGAVAGSGVGEWAGEQMAKGVEWINKKLNR